MRAGDFILFLIYAQIQKHAWAKVGTENFFVESKQLEPSVDGYP